MTIKRIAVKSNYDDEMFEEYWLNVLPMDELLAIQICNRLNDISPRGPLYYKPVDPDYELHNTGP